MSMDARGEARGVRPAIYAGQWCAACRQPVSDIHDNPDEALRRHAGVCPARPAPVGAR